MIHREAQEVSGLQEYDIAREEKRSVRIYHNMEKSNADTCVALGSFDGIHIGHAAVILEAVNSGFESVVFTFDDNPRNYFQAGSVREICTSGEKDTIFAKLGVDVAYHVPFADVVDLSAEDFVMRVLRDTLSARKVVCGFNYHFGRGKECDALNLRDICATYGINVQIIDPVTVDGRVVSSTRIRKELEQGNIKVVENLLYR